MTAIFITYGPATKSSENISGAINNGANAFRFSASKYTLRALSEQAEKVNRIAKDKGVFLDLFLDLPGSKMRLTNNRGFKIKKGEPLRINYNPLPAVQDSSPPEIGLKNYSNYCSFDVGDLIFLGDGEDALIIKETFNDYCIAHSMMDGVLDKFRGVVISGKTFQNQSLTESDREALGSISLTPFTGVILSFVENPSIILDARKAMINGHKENIAIPPIIAKIETKKGANYVSEIANVADAILLGRGDLLLDTGPFDFYKIQKKVISTVFELNKPLIIGTDLLPSLSENWLPNRSELAHLCYLFEKGVDAVLLSHETTVGKHPLRTIEIIDGLRQNYETNSIRSIFAPR